MGLGQWQLTMLVNSLQLALKVRSLLHNIDDMDALQPLDHQAQLALPPPLHAADFGHARILKHIVFGRLHRVVLITGTGTSTSPPSARHCVPVVAEQAGPQRHAGKGDGCIRSRRGADAVYLCEDGGNVRPVVDGDLERRAGQDGVRRREGDEREHLCARLAGGFAHVWAGSGRVCMCVCVGGWGWGWEWGTRVER